MTLRWLIILAIYFVLGAFMLAMTARTKDTWLQRWTKYAVYLFIVALVLLLDWLKLFSWTGLVLVGIGLVEMITVWLHSDKKPAVLFKGLLLYWLIAYCFVRFSFQFPVSYVYGLVVIFDGMAQLTGQLIGGKKISPRTSPNKTVSGFLGGCVAVFLLLAVSSSGEALLLQGTERQTIGHALVNLLWALFYAFALGGIAFAGDLLASKYKRVCGLKDYGSWIPGHGGLLDRFDSFMFTAAVLYVGSVVLDALFR